MDQYTINDNTLYIHNSYIYIYIYILRLNANWKETRPTSLKCSHDGKLSEMDDQNENLRFR